MVGTKTKASSDTPARQTIRQILERAVKAGASDVHFEPRDGFAVVRQRVNGLLQVTAKLPGAGFGSMVAELKNSAGLNKKREPQTGRYRLLLGRHGYDVNVATLPVMDGERVTLHLTAEDQVPLALSELGIWGSTLGLLTDALLQPHGLILVSSSDDSAALTLNSLLSNLVGSHLRVATVEQKLLYRLSATNQTLVKQELGMTFARRLKQILREQPDVVMVSDVLDKTTARTLAKASADRQLVLAGLHATNSASSLLGFNQLSGEPNLVGTNILVALSQKLLPRLCPDCREAYTPDAKLQAKLVRLFGLDNSGRMQRLHELVREAAGSDIGSEPSTNDKKIFRLWRSKAGGCKACQHTGFQNRILITEIIPTSPALQASLMSNSSAAQLRKVARATGMVPLAQDALVKALCGLLPIEVALSNTLLR